MDNLRAAILQGLALGMLCVSNLVAGDEFALGTGYEPVVNCDRVTDSQNGNKRVQVVWVGIGSTIQRRFTHNLGTSWQSTDTYQGPNASRLDSVAAANVGVGSTPHMYFGWLDQVAPEAGITFFRSTSGNTLDNQVIAQSNPSDRPWLVCNSSSLYLSYSNSTSAPNAYVKRAAMTTGTISWSGTSVLAGQPIAGTTLTSNFPIATHRDSAGNETVYLAMRQRKPGSVATLFDNSLRIRKSTDQSATWSASRTDCSLQGVDGFVTARDDAMLAYHVVADPDPTDDRAYAFFVRNEAVPLPQDGPSRNVLYCRASFDSGATWNGEVKVYTIGAAELPANWADVPENASGSTAGFFRIGRVWSCIAPDGDIYVCWMDNRYGRFGTGTGSNARDYWHVFYSKSEDFGDTWTTPVRVSAPNASGSGITANASIGGYEGTPAGDRGSCIPPGDVLTCDVDAVNLYVTWCDTRNKQSDPDNDTQVYVNVITR